MKYILLIVLALVILRIDMFVGVIERAWKRIPNLGTQETIESFEVPAVSSLAVADLPQNEVSQFQLLLAEFVFNPNQSTKDLIIGYLRKNPAIIGINPQNLYAGLEQWSGFIREDNPEVLLLLNAFMETFKTQSLKVVQQFYSNYLDANPELFFHYYPFQRDPNCIVASYAWNNSNNPESDVLRTRKEKIEDVSTKIEANKLEFSKNCLLVIRVELSKTVQPLETL